MDHPVDVASCKFSRGIPSITRESASMLEMLNNCEDWSLFEVRMKKGAAMFKFLNLELVK